MLDRKDEESRIEYGMRLIEGKIENTVDIEWQDIVDLLGLDIHRDTLRKACQGEFGSYNVMKFFKEKMTEEKIGYDGLSELDLKIIELKKERKKLQTISLEYNKMLREKARDELIIESVRDIIPTVEKTEFKPIKPSYSDTEWILSFGDIHFDKFFESVNNFYNTDEIVRRFSLLLGSVVEQIEEKGIEHITVLNLGDSLEGLLRISALRTMRHGLLNSVVMFSRMMGDWLNELSKHVEITYRHVETANHSELRMFNQKRGETDENLELLIINYIHDYLKDNVRVNVVIENKPYIEFELNGYNFIALHGDAIKNRDSALKDLTMLHRKFYDYVMMGHFHSGMTKTVAEGLTNNKDVIIVPSFIGSDPYSDSLLVGSKGAAKLYGVTANGITKEETFILN